MNIYISYSQYPKGRSKPDVHRLLNGYIKHVLSYNGMHTATWKNLKNMLCERDHTQKAMQCKLPFLQNVQNGQFHRERKQIRAAPAGRKER
jgi:hypothetical protein